jgi:hypothetical protein
MEKNIRISTLKELELQIKKCSVRRKVTEARVSAACNTRIIKQDGQGVNGMYIDTVAVVVVEDQDEDLECVGMTGK